MASQVTSGWEDGHEHIGGNLRFTSMSRNSIATDTAGRAVVPCLPKLSVRAGAQQQRQAFELSEAL